MTLWYEPFMQRALLAVSLAGISCAIVGVLVFSLRLSSIGICISHAALAGALAGMLWGVPPIAGALGASLVAAGALGPLADRGHLSLDAVTNAVFSASLAAAFLFLALLPSAKAEALGWLWGNVLIIRQQDLLALAGITVLILTLITLSYKELLALLFSRELAEASGVPTRTVLYGVLVCSGAVIAASLSAVGGLLVFSLLINPAAAAYQFGYRLSHLLWLSATFAVVSGWFGLALSATFNLPSGATIALSSAVVLALSLCISPKRRLGGTHGS